MKIWFLKERVWYQYKIKMENTISNLQPMPAFIFQNNVRDYKTKLTILSADKIFDYDKLNHIM